MIAMQQPVVRFNSLWIEHIQSSIGVVKFSVYCECGSHGVVKCIWQPAWARDANDSIQHRRIFIVDRTNNSSPVV